jgi:stress response protein YsnF
VRVRRDVVTEDQQITTELRRERAEVDQTQGDA